MIAAFLVPALLVAGVLPAGAPDQSSREIVEASDIAVGLRVLADKVGGVSTILTDVVVDEEFMEQNGTDWRDALDLVLDSANDILKDVDVRVESVSISTWKSNDEQTHMSQILDGVLLSTQRGSGRLMLAITCQDSVRFDGIARESVSAVVIRHVHDNWQRNGSLMAHEIAHLLGAVHHPETETCESDGCLMEPAGYANATEWCDEHREAIGAYLAEAAT